MLWELLFSLFDTSWLMFGSVGELLLTTKGGRRCGKLLHFAGFGRCGS